MLLGSSAPPSVACLSLRELDTPSGCPCGCMTLRLTPNSLPSATPLPSPTPRTGVRLTATDDHTNGRPLFDHCLPFNRRHSCRCSACNSAHHKRRLCRSHHQATTRRTPTDPPKRHHRPTERSTPPTALAALWRGDNSQTTTAFGRDGHTDTRGVARPTWNCCSASCCLECNLKGGFGCAVEWWAFTSCMLLRPAVVCVSCGVVCVG